MLSTEHSYRTRMGGSGGVRLDETYRYKTDLPMKSFRYRGSHEYNAIPADIRGTRSLDTFKIKLKKWIISNISPD